MPGRKKDVYWDIPEDLASRKSVLQEYETICIHFKILIDELMKLTTKGNWSLKETLHK